MGSLRERPSVPAHHIHNSAVPTGRPQCWVDPHAGIPYPCGDYFTSPNITESNPQFIMREAAYMNTATGFRGGAGYTITQQIIKPEFLAGDVRVSYFSEKYPSDKRTLKHVHTFMMPFHSNASSMMLNTTVRALCVCVCQLA
jgi:hypothetical protein